LPRKSNAANVNGLFLLHKQPGLTSFESLGFLKRAFQTGKAGHTGTLDKFASGLLLVLVGQAGKLASIFSHCDKEYEGVVRFGAETDTLDPEGIIIAEAGIPSRETVEAVLSGFRGEILQAPPAYSAIHIDGVRAHELTRQGIAPEMKKRPVTISKLEIISWEPPFAGIRVCCSPGTYIRSLARDIALAAGSRAHLTGLVRTRIGGFNLADAFLPDAAQSAAVLNALRPITPAVFTAAGLPFAFCDENQARAITHGKSLDLPLLKTLVEKLPAAPAVGIFSLDGRLAATLEQHSGAWQYGRVFASA
jgi:tRNA pseudouridine55 synthase